MCVLFLVPFNVFGAEISAESTVVIDGTTGEILFEKNKDEQRSIASTTKILTAYIACLSGKLDDIITVTDEMVNTTGTSLGLRAGDKISVYDATVGMMLCSGNDAANSVALYLSGSFEKFADLMNKTASDLKMRNSYFVTPSGLDEANHHSTAYDMAVLTLNALNNKIFSEICCEKSKIIRINGKEQTIYNHNKLLSYIDGCVGVKTGFTEKAGRCLVSAVKKNETVLICVTLNDPDDWNDHISLYDECFKKYESIKVENNVKINVVGGSSDYLNATYSGNVFVLNKQNISVEIYHFPFLYEPIKNGDKIGFVVIKYKEKEISKLPLTATENIEYYGKQ